MLESFTAGCDLDAPTVRILIALFQRLELGVIIITEQGPQITLVNAAGADLLARFGWHTGEPLPAELQAAVASALPLGRAVPITAPDDSAFHLRLRTFPPLRMLTVRRHRTSASERLAVLRETFGFTPQEVRLVELVRAGMSNAEIGRAMKLRPTTVKQYLNQIYAAVGVHSRVKLVANIEQVTCDPRRNTGAIRSIA